MPGAIGTARNDGRRVQRVQELQRIAMAVERTVRPSGDLGPEPRKPRRESPAIEDVDGIPPEPGLRLQRSEASDTLRQLFRGEAHVDAAGLRQCDVDPGLAQELRGEPRPLARRALRPRSVGCKAHALPLHPNQAEIAARGAMRDVAFVEQRELRPQRAQPERDRGTDQAAADHRDLERGLGDGHALHPQKRSTDATSAPKSTQPWSPPPATYWNAPA